jgi:hypothetical protein
VSARADADSISVPPALPSTPNASAMSLRTVSRTDDSSTSTSFAQSERCENVCVDGHDDGGEGSFKDSTAEENNMSIGSSCRATANTNTTSFNCVSKGDRKSVEKIETDGDVSDLAHAEVLEMPTAARGNANYLILLLTLMRFNQPLAL